MGKAMWSLWPLWSSGKAAKQSRGEALPGLMAATISFKSGGVCISVSSSKYRCGARCPSKGTIVVVSSGTETALLWLETRTRGQGQGRTPDRSIVTPQRPAALWPPCPCPWLWSWPCWIINRIRDGRESNTTRGWCMGVEWRQDVFGVIDTNADRPSRNAAAAAVAVP